MPCQAQRQARYRAPSNAQRCASALCVGSVLQVYHHPRGQRNDVLSAAQGQCANRQGARRTISANAPPSFKAPCSTQLASSRDQLWMCPAAMSSAGHVGIGKRTALRRKNKRAPRLNSPKRRAQRTLKEGSRRLPCLTGRRRGVGVGRRILLWRAGAHHGAAAQRRRDREGAVHVLRDAAIRFPVRREEAPIGLPTSVDQSA